MLLKYNDLIRDTTFQEQTVKFKTRRIHKVINDINRIFNKASATETARSIAGIACQVALIPAKS